MDTTVPGALIPCLTRCCVCPGPAYILRRPWVWSWVAYNTCRRGHTQGTAVALYGIGNTARRLGFIQSWHVFYMIFHLWLLGTSMWNPQTRRADCSVPQRAARVFQRRAPWE